MADEEELHQKRAREECLRLGGDIYQMVAHSTHAHDN